ncbi:MAG: hypothetical protein IT529_05700 [Burkholderiales bacterium]|nr:hypothetical protein [Burkholderiales bacterium]
MNRACHPESMRYSRAAPSPRYAELQRLYRDMHERGEPFLNMPPEKTLTGLSLPPQAGRIKRLIEATGARTVLDYGSGKGLQYRLADFRDAEGRRWPGIVDYWGVDYVGCYDPGFAPFSRIPTETFDGVISTDVLEHCPEEDMPWILGEIFGFARRFVFANVACYPATKRLANGENAHCTIRPGAWWRGLFEATAAAHPGIVWEAWIESRVAGPEGVEVTEERAGGT